MPSKSISVFRERYCRRVVRDLPKDLEPDELDPLGVLRARVAPVLAMQPAAPRGTPAHRRPAHFNIPGSPPSSRPLSLARERSFHLGVNKPADRPARTFDRYATSKGALAETTVNYALELQHHVGDLEPVRDNGAALYDRYAASHGGMVAVPDHDTTLSRDPALREQQWDAVEEHERSHRVKQEPGPPRIAIFYERAPELFDAAAAQARCPQGLRELIAKEQKRIATGGVLSKIHQTLGMEWIDDVAPAAQDWLARLPGWDPETSKDKRLSRVSQGRGPLTHIAGEIEYPKELLAEAASRERIRRGLLSWFDDLGRDGDGDASILPAAVYDHLPDRLNDRRNMHCHFIIGSRRAKVGEGGGLTFNDNKVDAITRMGFHERLRGKFADLVNVELERLAVDHRLHPGTHAEMGIDHVMPNRKVSGRGTVLERASIPTADGLFNDIENWSRKFDLAAKRYQMRQQQIADTNANDAARAMMLQAATLRYEAEQIGLLVGMSVSRAKRTTRFAPAYADAAKRDRDRQGWLARGAEAKAFLGALDDDLVEERSAIVERRREAASLDRAASERAVSERRLAIQAAAARAASHRAVDIVARTPLLITELDGTYAIDRSDDPEGLVAGIDLGAVDIQKRLQGQHAAQRKALAQVRSYMHKHGHAGLFDEAKIGRSAWLRSTIEQWRSSPIITREEAERSVRADAHRATLVARNTGMRTERSETIDQLAELGLIELAPQPTLPTPVVEPEPILSIEPPSIKPVQPVPTLRPITAHSEWPWRPGAPQPIPTAIAQRWRDAERSQFATDITAFEHVLSVRPDKSRITDRRLLHALGERAAMIAEPDIHDRLTAIWLYQQATRHDLLATCQVPHIVPYPEPPFDQKIGRTISSILADRERHDGDAVLGSVYDLADRGELAVPKPPLGNRLIRATLDAIAAGESPAVCRLLADAALAQDGALQARRLGLSERQDAILWAASSMPGNHIFRNRPKRGRSRGAPSTSPSLHPGRR